MKVFFTYFKPSGKYYSSGEYGSTCTQMYEVFDEVRTLQADGKLPGLCLGGGKDFTIHVDSDDPDVGCPALIHPIK